MVLAYSFHVILGVNSYAHSVQAVVWFLARWSATYLMPPDESKESASSDNHKAKHHKKVLLNFCGEDNQGKAVLDLIIRIVMVALISYPGERDLQVCRHNSITPIIQNVHMFALASPQTVRFLEKEYTICYHSKYQTKHSL